MNKIEIKDWDGKVSTSNVEMGLIIGKTGHEERNPISEEDCLKMEGHCWNYHQQAECVDKFGNKTGMTYAIYLTNPRQYRTCKHCAKRQVKTPEAWNDE